MSLRSWGVAYVTNTVVQGDRASNTVGVDAFRNGGGLYAEGVHELVRVASFGALLLCCKSAQSLTCTQRPSCVRSA